MITGFKDRETEKVWTGSVSRRLPQAIQAIARRKLRMLNNACDLNDLRVPPANRLEALKGRRKGQYSIRITTNGASALSGTALMRAQLKSSITIRGNA